MHTAATVNTGAATMAGGGFLTALGLRRGGLLGLLAAAAGAYIAYRAYCRVRGGCEAKPDREKCRALLDTLGAGVTTGIYDHAAHAAKEARTPAGEAIDDVVLDSGDDSFPCSDPPSFSPRSEAAAAG